MNYLAHAYLSFNRPGILVGNMISDFVKGKKKYDYPEQVQRGIALHREIDQFTDTHSATREAKEIFRPVYRLYAGSLMDVIYDHFLALDENEFTAKSLERFTVSTYATLDQFTDLFPEKFNMMYPYMKAHNWLYNYRYRQGVEKSLAGVVRRAKFLEESDSAYLLFNEHYDRLRNLYRLFFPELKSMTLNLLKQFDK
ncbi:MAG TPA: ACP phosphodiesterase [Chitinophagaceae bacterium]